tara:strand:- start:896 stop:1165 length:270 start_codon:yes stop_codon:yes gene_type:complete
MTITSPDIIKQMLQNGGAYPGDPPASLIYRYTGMPGTAQELYAVFMHPDHDDMDSSPFVHNVVCLMANGILTVDGEEWLETQTPNASIS